MELFIDTSALAKYYYPEPGSEDVESMLLAADKVFISRLSIVEMASALAKKQREQTLAKDAEIRIWNAFQDDLHSEKLDMVSLDEEIVSRAAALIRDLGAHEGLRALDALQLASAMNHRQALFLSADQRLSRIAILAGLRVPSPFTPENSHNG